MLYVRYFIECIYLICKILLNETLCVLFMLLALVERRGVHS